MRILLTGRDGQLGWELERALAPLGVLMATGRAALDLASADAIRRMVRQAKPEAIVNAAAYTAVDQAESEPAHAHAINATAPGVLAEEAKRLGALLVHYSTDYVFDGAKAEPYVEDDAPNPINAYGASKLAGERAIQASGCRHLILRTSWLYSLRGSNFLLTVLRLARERPRIRIVADQRGTPTSARLVAEATARALLVHGGTVLSGVLHLAASGIASRHEFAAEALRLAGIACEVEAATSIEFPLPARRPACSALDSRKFERTFGVELPGWREDLARCLESGSGGGAAHGGIAGRA